MALLFGRVGGVAIVSAALLVGACNEQPAPSIGKGDAAAGDAAVEQAVDRGAEMAADRSIEAREAGGDGGADVAADGARDMTVDAAGTDAAGEASDARDAGAAADTPAEAGPVDAPADVPVDAGTPDDAAVAGCAPSLAWLSPFTATSPGFSAPASVGGRAVALAPNGDVVFAGEYRGVADFGGGALPVPADRGMFVARFDSGGHHIWSKGLPAWVPESGGKFVAVDHQGAVMVTGYVMGTIDFGGGPLTGDGMRRPFLLKLDAGGNFVYAKSWAGGTFTPGSADHVAVDANDNVVFSGNLLGNVDFGGGTVSIPGVFIVKFDSLGNHLFGKGFGNQSTAVNMRGLAVDPSGNVFFTALTRGMFGVDVGGGQLPGRGLATEDVLIAKWDANGQHVWSKLYGDSDPQIPIDLAADAAGRIVVTGYFESGIDFGGRTLVSAGSSDIFVALLDGDGNHVQSRRFGDAAFQTADALALDEAGNVTLVGSLLGAPDFGGGPLTTAGYGDAFMLRLDPSLRYLCGRRWGDEAAQRLSGVAAGGGVVVFAGTNAGTMDLSDIGGGMSVGSSQGTGFMMTVRP